MRAANSEANASRISYVEQCFGSAGQVCEFNFLFFFVFELSSISAAAVFQS